MSSPTKPHQVLSDDQLRTAVLGEIEWNPAIKSKDIGVDVRGGVVMLTGFIHTYSEKYAAERAAQSLYGVISLANDIEVRPSTVRTDPEIARDICEALKIHAFVPEDKIKATVDDGFVTLEGSLEWNYQRDSAESSARNVIGVRGVLNNICLQPQILPSMVKEGIEEALRRNAEVDERRINVTSNDGTVELYGDVGSWLEREEAERAAWAAPGVSSVSNHIVISPIPSRSR